MKSVTLIGILSLALASNALAQTGAAQPAKASKTAPSKSAATAKSAPLTQAQGDEILQELRNIRQMLEGIRSREMAAEAAAAPPSAQQPAQPPSRAVVKIDPARTIGDPKAPITIAEFTDYQCGFCSLFHRETFPHIKREFVDTGLVRFASLDLPLDMHSEAFAAAKASRCALEQGKYWEYRDRLSSRLPSYEFNALVKLGAQLGLDEGKLRECMSAPRHDAGVKADMLQAQAINLSGTPSFVVGASTVDGVEGEAVVGAYPFEVFKGALDKLRTALKPQP